MGEETLSPIETLRCTIEVVSWVTKFIGGPGSGRKEFEESFVPGETVREVLGRFSARYPELDLALWDASKKGLGEHIEVMVNNAVLGVSHTLDSPLRANDRITLIGQYMGGAPSRDELLREIAECEAEALRLQARVTEVTEQAYRQTGVAAHWDRSLHGKITGLCYGVLAHLEELKRLLKEEA